MLSAAATGAAFLLTFPPATWLGHRRRGGFVFVNLANLGRAIPSLAILLLAVQWLGLEEWPVVGSVTAFLTLTALALAPIATNTYVGLRDVPDAVRESAAAMGFRGRQQVWPVELPLAAPLVITGVRTAAVAVVATATLAASWAVAAWAGSSSTASPYGPSTRWWRGRWPSPPWPWPPTPSSAWPPVECSGTVEPTGGLVAGRRTCDARQPVAAR